MRKKHAVIYVVIFMSLCLVPSVGLLLGGREDSAENEDRASAPSFLTDNGGVNTDILSQAGDWFEGNFAWRQELVTANNKVNADIFKVSADDGVILGKNGWLYYSDSLNDYTGAHQLSDRALYDIARTARITQDYFSYLNSDYLFVIAPDKATVYPEYMPYYYMKVSDTSNRKRLKAFMDEEGVNYLDLTDILAEEAARRSESPSADDALECIYHKRDSHWTSEGAAMAAGEILDRLGINHRDYNDADKSVRKDFDGDLDEMLYPAAVEPEEEVYYSPEPSFEYTEDVESNFAYSIHTVSDGEGMSLLMYRDSFTNALLPFLAENYSMAYFSRAVPFDILVDWYQTSASAIIQEHAERNLPDVASRAPILQTLETGLVPDSDGVSEAAAVISVEEEEANAYYTKVTGIPGEEPESGTRFYIDPGDGVLYEAMPVHLQDEDEEAFIMYLPADIYPADELTAERITVYKTGP